MFLTGIHRARDQEEHQEGMREDFRGYIMDKEVDRYGEIARGGSRIEESARCGLVACGLIRQDKG